MPETRPETTRQTNVLVWLLALAATGVYTLISLSRYTRLLHESVDLAIFTQAVSRYSQLQAPIIDIRAPGLNALGDHFSPINAVLGIPWRVWPDPSMLLVAQALLLGLSVVPVTRIAIRRLGKGPGFVVGASYALSWGLQFAAKVDFHEIAFAVPLIAFSLEAYLEGRWARSVLWAAPLLLVKEDLGLTVAMLGVLLLVARQRWLGAATLVAGLVGTVLSVFVVIPHFNGGNPYRYLTNLGTGESSSGLSGALSRILANPLSVAEPGAKWLTLGGLLLVSVGMLVRSPIGLMALPTLLWRFTSDVEFHWGPGYHYDAILMPIAFLSLVDGVVRLRDSDRAWEQAWARVAIPLAAVATLALLVVTPLAQVLQIPSWADQRAEYARQMLAAIPPGAVVESDSGLIERLAATNRTYFIENTRGVVTPDLVVIDVSFDSVQQSLDQLTEYVTSLHPGIAWKAMLVEGPFVLFARE